MADDLRQRVRTALESITEQIGGDSDALFSRVYDELRNLASRYLRRERPDHTLQPTALVHEAYMRIKGGADFNTENVAHFRAIAARIMRQLLIEHARSKGADKRGGGRDRVTLATDMTPGPSKGIDVLALEEALGRLREIDPRLVDVIELRFFGGMTINETAGVLNVSPTVVKDDWRSARALITNMLADGA